VTIWSLRQALTTINGDLPDGFDASVGITSLFPAGQNALVSQLQRYRFLSSLSLVSGHLRCDAVVRATGSGKWVLSGTLTSNAAVLTPVHYNVGFAFKLPVSGFVRGAFASGGIPIHTGTISWGFLASGRDDWIVQHWPGAFADGIVGKLVVSDDVGELIRELEIVAGVSFLTLATGGGIAVAFG